MDRTNYPKYVPYCPAIPALVDQYMVPVKIRNNMLCINGISRNIYDPAGNLSYTLPLSEYPGNNIHPEIRKTFGWK